LISAIVRVSLIIALTLLSGQKLLPAAQPGAAAQASSSNAPLLGYDAAADSVYTAGRLALNRSDYANAIVSFTDVARRYPMTYFAPNAWYWLAYTQYRTGIDRDDQNALRDAANSLSAHRALYRNAHNRVDVAELFQRVRAALAARGNAAATEAMQTSRVGIVDFIDCAQVDAVEFAATLKSYDVLEGEAAARSLGGMVFGAGMCADLTLAEPIYGRVAGQRDAKEFVIAALGRSLHPSATAQLIAIAKREPDLKMRELVVAWLRVRNDARVNEFLRSLGR
jgi:hypothetical protein